MKWPSLFGLSGSNSKSSVTTTTKSADIPVVEASTSTGQPQHCSNSDTNHINRRKRAAEDRSDEVEDGQVQLVDDQTSFNQQKRRKLDSVNRRSSLRDPNRYQDDDRHVSFAHDIDDPFQPSATPTGWLSSLAKDACSFVKGFVTKRLIWSGPTESASGNYLPTPTTTRFRPLVNSPFGHPGFGFGSPQSSTPQHFAFNMSSSSTHHQQPQQQPRQSTSAIPTVDLTADDSDDEQPVMLLEEQNNQQKSMPSEPASTSSRYGIRSSAESNGKTHLPTTTPNGNGTDRDRQQSPMRRDVITLNSTDSDEPRILKEVSQAVCSSSGSPSPSRQSTASTSNASFSLHARRSYLSPFGGNSRTREEWANKLTLSRVLDQSSNASFSSSQQLDNSLNDDGLQERRRYEQLLDSIGVSRGMKQHRRREGKSADAGASSESRRFGDRPILAAPLTFDSHRSRCDDARALLSEFVGESRGETVRLDDESGQGEVPDRTIGSPARSDISQGARNRSFSYCPATINSLRHRFDQYDPQKVIDAARQTSDHLRSDQIRSTTIKNELELIREARHARYRNQSELMYLKNRFTDLHFLEFPEPVIKNEFPEITAKMNKVIDYALTGGGPNDKICDAFSISITRKDLATLTNLNWLNDEVINFYTQLLQDRSQQKDYRAAGMPTAYAFNTFFYPKILSAGQKSVSRWTRRVDIFALDMLIVPVHLGVHWCMAIVDMRYKVIKYFDSMGGQNWQCLDALKQYLMDESLEKKKKTLDMTEWDLKIEDQIPQQENGSDCGMFACRFAEYTTRDAVINFSQEHMPYFRRRTIYEIVNKKLLL